MGDKMIEVLIEKIEYIKNIPIELTERAVKAGAIRQGETVGLIVSTRDEKPEKFRIELKVGENGQENLIRPGRVIPVNELRSGRYAIDSRWEHYI